MGEPINHTYVVIVRMGVRFSTIICVSSNQVDCVPTILLVEDNPADVGLMRLTLVEHNIPHNLRVIDDGLEALKFASRIRTFPGLCPDLVVVDVVLPKFDGLQVLSEIRKCPRCVNVPVIVMSVVDWPADELAELRVNRFIRKTSSLADCMNVGSVVRELLSQN